MFLEEIVMAEKYPIETKVVAASWTSTAAAFIVGWIVVAVPGLSSLAAPLQAVIVAALTGLAALAAGWVAKHSPRAPKASAGKGEAYHKPGV